MDKETLSNYGWIVICVLVLAVMIALATPFGNFISTAVKSTTQGLFDTNKNALNSTGLINIGDQSFDSKGLNDETATFYYDHSDYLYLQIPVSGNMTGAPTIEEGRKFIKEYAAILLGASFDDYLRDTGATEDELWTELKLTDETFEPAVLGNGWSVCVKSTEQTAYAPILESINGIPITNMDSTFKDCTSLKTSPKIPNSVTNMNYTFDGCTSLTTAPEIPNSVTDMVSTFAGCTSLATAPTMPNGVTYMGDTFYGCTSLTTAPAIPNSVTDMYNTFAGCTSLTTAPEIPNSVTSMFQTFLDCKSLTTAPVIPNGVTDMSSTFMDCTSLTAAPEIPNSVTSMFQTFLDCKSLTTATAIPNGVTNMKSTFSGCESITTAPAIPNSVTDMYNTFYYCTSLTGTIEINANPSDYSNCLRSTQITAVTGSTTLKAEILATK